MFYDGEEVADEHNGLRRLFAERPELVAGDLAILLEPTGGWIEAGCQGTIHVRATFDGARAHSARPWMGVNAIHRAAPLLARIARATRRATVDVDGARRTASRCRSCAIEGGHRQQRRARPLRGRRQPPLRAGVLARRRGRARPSRSARRGADEVEVLNASPAAPPNLTHPLDRGADRRRATSPVRPKLGWTDVARFAAHGIPACNFGPGDPELAHTADERVERVGLDACLASARSVPRRSRRAANGG